MRLGDRDEPLDPEVERDLDAVDRALAGRGVDPDLAGWEELTALLAEERPEPAPGWSEELDRRVAAGFPRVDGGLAAFADRLRAKRPMQLLAPAGAVAMLAVVAVVTVSTIERETPLSGGDDDAVTSSDLQSIEGEVRDLEGSSGASGEDAAAVAPSAEPLGESPVAEDSDFDFNREDKLAPGTENRKLERDARLVLSTKPEDVRSTTDEAIAITRSLDGIVVSSQINEEGRSASATLEVTIPTRNLDAALDQLTELANVESLAETMEDITKPVVSAQDELEDAEAERVELLKALGNAETAAEAEALRIQIADARQRIARAEAVYENLAQRARLADLSVRIEGDPNAEDDGRSLGDWADDALDVLKGVAGVLLVSAAIVVPLGILIALIWLAWATVRRHRRERALD